MATLQSLSAPLLCAGLAAIGYGSALRILALRQQVNGAQQGRAFSISTAFVFASILACILVASAAPQDLFGGDRHYSRCSPRWLCGYAFGRNFHCFYGDAWKDHGR
jgi:hypothetical protein